MCACIPCALSSLNYNALYTEIDPVKLGLSKDGKKAYVQCLDPCDYTGSGTVIFQIAKDR